MRFNPIKETDLVLSTSLFAVLLILAMVECRPKVKSERLLLLNVFNRHGDRAPVRPLPMGDRHAERLDFFWPNGLDNLTSDGERRMFNLGLALRQKYKQFLDFDTDSVLALSSKMSRCKLSLLSTLEGFYDMTRDLAQGEDFARKLRLGEIDDLPKGSGSSKAWRDIRLDENIVRTLSYDVVRDSPYMRHHRNPVKDDLANYNEIKNLAGYEKLKETIKQYYGMDMTSKVLTLLSTIQSELYFDRTRETIGYLDHLAKWIDEPAFEEGDSKITMLELLDQVNLLAFIGMIDENENYLITAPIVHTLIESQIVALNQISQLHSSEILKNSKYYSKKVIFYSSHDTILSLFLVDMGIISPIDGASFASRLIQAKQANASDLEKLTQGLTTCHYGVSAIFELWIVETESGSKFPVVRLSMYNEPDPKASKIEWKLQPLGAMCQRRLRELYPDEVMSNYYPQGDDRQAIDQGMDCPFEMFKKIADKWKYDQWQYRKIYHDNL